MKHLLLGIIFLIFSHTTLSTETDFNNISNFELESNTGKDIRLSDLKGNIVILNFWATWCRPCRIEMPILEQLHQQYQDSNVIILGINIEDTRRENKKLAIDDVVKKMKLTFPILYDNKKSLVRSIERQLLNGKNLGVPSTIFIDYSGKTRFFHQGYRNGDSEKYQRMIMSLIKEKT